MAFNNTLGDGEKMERPRSPRFLDPRGEQSDLEQGSTRTPSTIPPDLDYEKKTEDSSSITADDERKREADAEQPSPDEATTEYPTGARLIFIVIALVLSIFLVSLDMVRPNPLANNPYMLQMKLN